MTAAPGGYGAPPPPVMSMPMPQPQPQPQPGDELPGGFVRTDRPFEGSPMDQRTPFIPVIPGTNTGPYPQQAQYFTPVVPMPMPEPERGEYVRRPPEHRRQAQQAEERDYVPSTPTSSPHSSPRSRSGTSSDEGRLHVLPPPRIHELDPTLVPLPGSRFEGAGSRPSSPRSERMYGDQPTMSRSDSGRRRHSPPPPVHIHMDRPEGSPGPTVTSPSQIPQVIVTGSGQGMEAGPSFQAPHPPIIIQAPQSGGPGQDPGYVRSEMQPPQQPVTIFMPSQRSESGSPSRSERRRRRRRSESRSRSRTPEREQIVITPSHIPSHVPSHVPSRGRSRSRSPRYSRSRSPQQPIIIQQPPTQGYVGQQPPIIVPPQTMPMPQGPPMTMPPGSAAPIIMTTGGRSRSRSRSHSRSRSPRSHRHRSRSDSRSRPPVVIHTGSGGPERHPTTYSEGDAGRRQRSRSPIGVHLTHDGSRGRRSPIAIAPTAPGAPVIIAPGGGDRSRHGSPTPVVVTTRRSRSRSPYRDSRYYDRGYRGRGYDREYSPSRRYYSRDRDRSPRGYRRRHSPGYSERDGSPRRRHRLERSPGRRPRSRSYSPRRSPRRGYSREGDQGRSSRRSPPRSPRRRYPREGDQGYSPRRRSFSREGDQGHSSRRSPTRYVPSRQTYTQGRRSRSRSPIVVEAEVPERSHRAPTVIVPRTHRSSSPVYGRDDHPSYRGSRRAGTQGRSRSQSPIPVVARSRTGSPRAPIRLQPSGGRSRRPIIEEGDAAGYESRSPTLIQPSEIHRVRVASSRRPPASRSQSLSDASRSPVRLTRSHVSRPRSASPASPRIVRQGSPPMVLVRSPSRRSRIVIRSDSPGSRRDRPPTIVPIGHDSRGDAVPTVVPLRSDTSRRGRRDERDERMRRPSEGDLDTIAFKESRTNLFAVSRRPHSIEEEPTPRTGMCFLSNNS